MVFHSPVHPPKTSYPSTEEEISAVKSWLNESNVRLPFRHTSPPEGYTIHQFLEDIVAMGPILMTRSYERDSPLVKAIIARADEFLQQWREHNAKEPAELTPAEAEEMEDTGAVW